MKILLCFLCLCFIACKKETKPNILTVKTITACENNQFSRYNIAVNGVGQFEYRDVKGKFYAGDTLILIKKQ